MTLNNEGFLLLRCLIYFRLSPKSCNRTTRRWASTVVLPPQAVSLLLLQFCAQSSTKHELGGCFQPICKNISQIGSLSPARGEHQKKNTTTYRTKSLIIPTLKKCVSPTQKKRQRWINPMEIPMEIPRFLVRTTREICISWFMDFQPCNSSPFLSYDTADGSEIPKPTTFLMYKTLINTGISNTYINWCRISSINSMSII